MPDLERAQHLPNLRPDREPPKKGWLPRQRRGITPQMIGRYPDYDVLSVIESWDWATRRVVEQRLRMAGRELAFFTEDEEATLRAFCDVVVAQDEDPRVPVPEMVDEKLAAGSLDGYQYAGMPDDRETWHRVLRGLDEAAARRYGKGSFAFLSLEEREAIVTALVRGNLVGGAWDGIDVKRAWSVCMRMILAAFYSHPWAWNEIGFGGPAYPRGFMRMGPVSTLEPYEKPGATAEDPAQIADILQS